MSIRRAPATGRRARVALLVSGALAAVGVAAFGAATPAGADPAIVFDGTPGTAVAPPTLGPYEMTAFGADPQPLFALVAGVADPAGTLAFAPSLDHRRIGAGWGTWSHGYTGAVYRTGAARAATITVPADTVAFAFYVEPQPFSAVSVTANAQDGTSSGPVPVNGFQGARYFGFYATGGAVIESIVVSAPTEFAIGEFSIAVAPRADCTVVVPDVAVLWPPNRELRAVTLHDPSAGLVGLTVTGAAHDDAGHSPPKGSPPKGEDVVLDDPTGDTVWLRAARNGNGAGRTYVVQYVATNGWGRGCVGSVHVAVPHDAGRSHPTQQAAGDRRRG